jgi:hypothetical protein
MSRPVVAVVCLAATLSLPGLAAGRAAVGRQAPWFRLERLKGKTVTSRQLLGRPAVLVVGRTQKAAPPCKEWALALIKRYGKKVPVFQVIVVAKPWYMPRSLVLRKVKGFSPREHHDRVLLEWYQVFAKAYGVAKHDLPVVLVQDRKGVIRLRYKGRMTTEALSRVTELVAGLR